MADLKSRTTMNKTDKIFVAGSTGMVGSAIVRKLKSEGYSNIVGTFRNRLPRYTQGVEYHKVDLLDQQQVKEFYYKVKPDMFSMRPQNVGGILSNNIYRADFLYENLQIQNNIIHNAYQFG